jgi:hypothetical protein
MGNFGGFLQWELQQQESRSRRDVKQKTQVGCWFEFYEASGIVHLMLKFSFIRGRGREGRNWRFVRRGIATARIKKYKECETKREGKRILIQMLI